jgi:hypothetical protein
MEFPLDMSSSFPRSLRWPQPALGWLLACLLAPLSADAAVLKPGSFALTSSKPSAGAGLAATATKRPDFGRQKPSRDVYQVASWVLASEDNKGAAFVIIDKPQARVYVFDPAGRLRGAAPVLLGLAKGDDTVPGIGEKKLADIRPEERTTPAGRFVAEPGRNARGEDIVWVDYDAAVSMHRVITSNPAERRLQRLASPTPKDNRISYGCINLPAAFFDKVLSPTVNSADTIVYVLPETRSPSAEFGFRVNGKGAPQSIARPDLKLQPYLLDGA